MQNSLTADEQSHWSRPVTFLFHASRLCIICMHSSRHRARGGLNCQFYRKWGCIVQKQACVIFYFYPATCSPKGHGSSGQGGLQNSVWGMCLIVAAGAKEHGNGEPFPMIETTEPQFYGTLSLFSRPLNLFCRPSDLSAIHYFQTTLCVFSEIEVYLLDRPGTNRKECLYIVQPWCEFKGQTTMEVPTVYAISFGAIFLLWILVTTGLSISWLLYSYGITLCQSTSSIASSCEDAPCSHAWIYFLCFCSSQ